MCSRAHSATDVGTRLRTDGGIRRRTAGGTLRTDGGTHRRTAGGTLRTDGRAHRFNRSTGVNFIEKSMLHRLVW